MGKFIEFKGRGSSVYINADNITYIESDKTNSDWTNIYFTGDKQATVCVPLNEVVQKLKE